MTDKIEGVEKRHDQTKTRRCPTVSLSPPAIFQLSWLDELRYCADFGRSRSNGMGIRMGPRISSLLVKSTSTRIWRFDSVPMTLSDLEKRDDVTPSFPADLCACSFGWITSIKFVEDGCPFKGSTTLPDPIGWDPSLSIFRTATLPTQFDLERQNFAQSYTSGEKLVDTRATQGGGHHRLQIFGTHANVHTV